MRPVPPGFNALVERQAAKLTELLGKHVLAVFHLDSDAAPVFEGSAVPVNAGGTHVLVSAAHIFDATSEGGVHLLLRGREQSPLELPARVSITSRPRVRTDDLLDLGYVRLTAEEIAAIGADNFVDLRRDTHLPERTWSSRNILFGFPEKRQARDDINLAYNLNQTRYTAPDLPAGKHAIAGLDGRHFSLRFERNRIASAVGRGGKPQFVGMSGGGVWVFDPYVEYSEQTHPPFVGVLAGPAPRNKKALFGPRAHMLFELLASESAPPAI